MEKLSVVAVDALYHIRFSLGKLTPASTACYLRTFTIHC